MNTQLQDNNSPNIEEDIKNLKETLKYLSPEYKKLRLIDNAISDGNIEDAISNVNKIISDKSEAHERNKKIDYDIEKTAHAKTQLTLSTLLYSNGQIEEAIESCKSAIQLLPNSEKRLRERYSKRIRFMLAMHAHNSVDINTARRIIFNSYSAKPNVLSYAVLINKANNFFAARNVFDEMLEAKIQPNIITFSTLIAKVPDYETARNVFDEMLEAKIQPDVITFSTLIAKVPDYETARNVFDEMLKAKIQPNNFTVVNITKHVQSVTQATELRQKLRHNKLAGHIFYESIFSQFCNTMSGKELLDWAFGDNEGFPHRTLGTAIAKFSRLEKIDDALRIASAFPFLPAALRIFKLYSQESRRYLCERYKKNQEPHHAANALGLFFKVQADNGLENTNSYRPALQWLQTALECPELTKTRREHIMKLIKDIKDIEETQP